MKGKDLRKLTTTSSDTVNLRLVDETVKSGVVLGRGKCGGRPTLFSILFKGETSKRDFVWSHELGMLVELCDGTEARNSMSIIGIV